MSKPWVHEDCLELVASLADMNCSASIGDGILTLEDGTQIDLSSTANKERSFEMSDNLTSEQVEAITWSHAVVTKQAAWDGPGPEWGAIEARDALEKAFPWLLDSPVSN